jgi:hypothetical protein
MRTALGRIQRIAIGILAVLSLSVSSVAACSCSHHGAETQPSKSCHGDSHEKHQKKEQDLRSPRMGESCVCIQATTQLYAKSESFKLKKLAPAFPGIVSVRATEIRPTLIPDDFPSRSPLYTSRLVTSVLPRGPPVL